MDIAYTVVHIGYLGLDRKGKDDEEREIEAGIAKEIANNGGELVSVIVSPLRLCEVFGVFKREAKHAT